MLTFLLSICGSSYYICFFFSLGISTMLFLCLCNLVSKKYIHTNYCLYFWDVPSDMRKKKDLSQHRKVQTWTISMCKVFVSMHNNYHTHKPSRYIIYDEQILQNHNNWFNKIFLLGG
jgi:hypothetical protein